MKEQTKEKDLKVCWIDNLPKNTKTLIFAKHSFATYDKELSPDELDNTHCF